MNPAVPQPPTACPLCGNAAPFRPLADRWGRHHWLCPGCSLVFTDRAELPDPDRAAARYALHRNGPSDPGYLSFLRRATEAAAPHLSPLAAAAASGDPSARALDYGCGPGPALHVLLVEMGIPCDDWDPCFFPSPPPLDRYPAVFATEVVEHFLHPARDWRHMLSLVSPGGLLVVMTSFWTDETSFPSWSYANDFTHVSFYHPSTLDWMAEHWNLTLLPSPDPRVALFRIPASPSAPP